ncbi:response regulator [Permianibacter aggregans]|uniref:Response regulator receiver domain-containing protein n=1 Tax=Permianibacter aggregans TaxID=1510150 RepID=A0A4R6UK94_9GAMM|nr:response regulator [Permianibacter aggregans]QGX40680.1 response regulator [Permianibacter aggregans]TDQ46556.1 response regulator receiver domain-containing protein [Permianibacter aggregans]
MPATPLNTILHVDDDASIRAVAKVALQNVGGLQVVSCASGIEALEKFPECRPDLVLLDVMMPLMDGPTTLQKLQRQFPNQSLRVVFMTAKVQQKEIDEYKTLGAGDVVIKPFDPMTLAAQLQQIWQRLP